MKRRRVTDRDRAEIAAFRALLAERFNARRCHLCGAPAAMVVVGEDAVVEFNLLLKRARPDRNLCLVHAGLQARAA